MGQQARVPVCKEHETPLEHTGNKVLISSGVLTPRAGMQIGSDTVRVGTTLRWEGPAASTRADLALGKGLPPDSLSCTVQLEPQDVPPEHRFKAKCEEMRFWNQGMHEVVLFPGDSFFTYMLSLKMF